MELTKDIAIRIDDLKEVGVVVQSMTNSKTADISSTKNQIEQLYSAGCRLIRVSTPTLKDVGHLSQIINELAFEKDEVTFIADVHYDIAVAIAAAKIVGKVRINPGNFLTKEEMSWPDEARTEILRIKLKPFIDTCKRHKTKVRIGVNHGSIYKGQKPMEKAIQFVDSLLEYVSIFLDARFKDLVLSIKSSDPWMMIEVNLLLKEKLDFMFLSIPIHLGVTEAGWGMEGRVNSAFGIGSCLLKNIGDTIRVSLTENPTHEVDVANSILNAVQNIPRDLRNFLTNQIETVPEVRHFLPESIVIHQMTSSFETTSSQKWQGDYIIDDKRKDKDLLRSVISFSDYKRFNFRGNLSNYSYVLANETDLVEVLNAVENDKMNLPILVNVSFVEREFSKICAYSIVFPHLLRRGIIRGLWLKSESSEEFEFQAEVASEILQVSGRKDIKSRIISCPGCSRTNFDLESITKKLKEQFSQEQISLSVMGCSVNGFGEMMKSDFGIIGSSQDKVDVYMNRQLIKSAVREEELFEILSNHIK